MLRIREPCTRRSFSRNDATTDSILACFYSACASGQGRQGVTRLRSKRNQRARARQKQQQHRVTRAKGDMLPSRLRQARAERISRSRGARDRREAGEYKLSTCVCIQIYALYSFALCHITHTHTHIQFTHVFHSLETLYPRIAVSPFRQANTNSHSSFLP